MAKRAKWANLPTVALVQIQSYLPRKDQLAVATVSKNWNFAFKDPRLWTSLEYSFTGNRKLDNKAIDFCRIHPTHVRKISFVVKCQDLGKFRRGILHVILCMNAVRKRKLSNVREFKMEIPNVNYLCNLHPNTRTKLVDALTGFLTKQCNLVSLEVTGLALPYDSGQALLSQVIRANKKISILTLKDFFALYKPDIFWEEFANMIVSLRQLAKISMTMDCLTDRVMEIMAKEGSTSLKHFSVRVGERHMDNVNSGKLTRTSQNFWTKLEKKNHGLTINVHTEDGVSITAVTDIFMRPGFKKQLTLKVPQSNPNRGIQAFLQHESQFLEELDSIKVVCNNNGMVDDCIINLLNRCINLRHFAFVGSTTNELVEWITTWSLDAQGRTIAIDNQPIAPPPSPRRHAANGRRSPFVV